jgi:hypothetical protein
VAAPEDGLNHQHVGRLRTLVILPISTVSLVTVTVWGLFPKLRLAGKTLAPAIPPGKNTIRLGANKPYRTNIVAGFILYRHSLGKLEINSLRSSRSPFPLFISFVSDAGKETVTLQTTVLSPENSDRS